MRKHITFTVMVAGLALLAPFLSAEAAPRHESSAATVIAVSRPAWWRDGVSGAWHPLSAGTVLSPAAWLRTGENGSVRLVTAKGLLIHVGAGKEQPLSGLGGSTEPKGVSILTLLHTLFISDQRTRVAASESVISSNLAVAQEPNERWESFMSGPALTAAQVGPALRLTAQFTLTENRNRGVALLLRLAHDQPNSPGLAQLAESARDAFGKPARLNAIIQSKDGGKVVPDGSTLHTGQRLHLEYRASSETVPYIFLRTVPEHGTAKTTALYPDQHSPGSLLPANVRLTLPTPGKTYRLDSAVGHEVLWAWVCTAPLASSTALKSSLERVAAADDLAGQAREQALVSAAPYLCPQTIVLQFIHE